MVASHPRFFYLICGSGFCKYKTIAFPCLRSLAVIAKSTSLLVPKLSDPKLTFEKYLYAVSFISWLPLTFAAQTRHSATFVAIE
jgi:hypothetical protein